MGMLFVIFVLLVSVAWCNNVSCGLHGIFSADRWKKVWSLNYSIAEM